MMGASQSTRIAACAKICSGVHRITVTMKLMVPLCKGRGGAIWGCRVGPLGELGGGKAALCGDPEELMEVAATTYAWLLTGRS